jgi:mRNA interferase MazF
MVNRRPGWAELWWTEFEGSAGRRPALVLTRPEAAAVLPRLLVAPATTVVRGLPSEVGLGPEDGVPKECVLNLDTPELVSRHHLVKYISTINALRWNDVCEALAAAVNCTRPSI